MLTQVHLRFFLDGIELIDNPQDWDKATVVLDRNSQENAIYTTYSETLTYHGDGYEYLINKIDTQNYCGEVQLEIYEYSGDTRRVNGFAFRGKVDLSDCEINRSKYWIKVSATEDTLVNLFRKFSTLGVPINNTLGETLNGETIANIGGQLNVDYNTNIYPRPSALGTDYIGYILHKDIFQYMLSYITDNKMLLESNLLQVNRFDERFTILTFSALGAGDVSTVTWTDFTGIRRTWTTTGVKTADQHAAAFVVDNIYHYSDEAGKYCNDLSKFYYILNNVDIAAIGTIHNPDFNTGAFVTETPFAHDPFVDGAANIGITTPFFISIQNVNNAVVALSFSDFYREFANIYDTELRFIKEAGQYKCQIEKRSDFINNATPTLTFYESNITEYTENYSDDLCPKILTWSQRSKDEKVCLLDDASYDFSGCGITEKKIDLQYFYGASYHIEVVADSKTSGEIMPIRYDDLVVAGAPSPTPYWTAMFLHGYDDNTNTINTGDAYRWMPGDFANHNMVVKRRLETIKATAEFNGFEITSDNLFRIFKRITFTYPMIFEDFKTLLDDPSSPVKLVLNNGYEKKAWIKKVSYTALTGITKFELYTG